MTKLITAGLFFVFGCCSGCAAGNHEEATQPFDATVRVERLDPYWWSIRFTRIEVWRPHSILSRPRKGQVESWLDVPHRIGVSDVGTMREASLPEVRTPFSKRSLPFRGEVTLTETTVIVAIFYSPDGKTWQPYEYNGTYRIEAKPQGSK